MPRQRISKAVESEVLTRSKRRCCVCYGLDGDVEVKPGQLAHLDHNPTNNDIDNLAFLCLQHHDLYDSRTHSSRALTPNEVKEYRRLLYSYLARRVDTSPPESPMSQYRLTLPAPSNWQDFERMCHLLWRHVWQDPAITRHGGMGQDDSGVDLYGTPTGSTDLVGVGCKAGQLNLQMIDEAISRADRFRPPISHYILATTSSRKAKLQERVRVISHERVASGKFSVQLHFWDDIEETLNEYPALLRQFYPQFADKVVPTVFISYAHESEAIKKQAISVADRLNQDGVDCSIDQYYVVPSDGWPRWMRNQLEAAHILVICTSEYKRRFEGESGSVGLGVGWEGAVISQHLYGSKSVSKRIIPVVLSSDDAVHIPELMRSQRYYDLSLAGGYADLYSILTKSKDESDRSERRLSLPLRHRAEQTFSGVFDSLSLFGWRQFDIVDLEFHPRMSIITGANGAGKTTFLNVLSQHAGWDAQFICTPCEPDASDEYSTDATVSDSRSAFTEADVDGFESIGRVGYSSGENCDIFVPKNADAPTYSLHFENQRLIPGIYIPSHRPSFGYQQVTHIPSRLDDHTALLSDYVQTYRQSFKADVRMKSTPLHTLKTAIISLATFGYGNAAIASDKSAVKTLETFQKILHRILPASLGFRRISVRTPEVVLETDTGDFSLDAISGGIAAVVDLAWQIHICSLIHDQFVVLIDEPENHLHPSLQRDLLPRLLDAFGTAQFIVATHNPFIVSSVADSSIFVLDYYESSRRVRSQQLDAVNRAGSANDILRGVLGVPVTMPVWVEDRLEQLVEKYRERVFSEEVLNDLKGDLVAIGLGDLFPSAVTKFMDKSL